MTDVLDTKVTEMLKQIQVKKQDLEKSEVVLKQSWKTNCSINLNNVNYNIQTLKEDSVIQLMSDLLKEQFFKQKALELLERDDMIKVSNFTMEDWIFDLKKRLTTISLKKQKEQLEKMEEKLNSLVSPEKKREMEIQLLSDSILNMK